MVHRLVILPDYQGLNIGTKFNDYCCDILLNQGLKVYLKTAHFKLMNYLKKSNKWQVVNEDFCKYKSSFDKFKNSLKFGENPHLTKKPFKVYNDSGYLGMSIWVNRSLISARFVGEDFFNKKHKIIVFEAEASKNETEKILKNYIKKYSDFYIEVICDDTKNNGITTLVCHKLGLCSYSLYDKEHKTINEFLKNYNKNDFVYIYDKIHNMFYDKFDDCEKSEIKDDLRSEISLIDFNLHEFL